MAEYAGRPNVYLSVGRFRGRRAVSRLNEQGALFCDLDYRKVTKVADLTADGVLHGFVLPTLDHARIPAPSFVVASGGGGLHLYWLHSAIPRAALPRWQTCQQVIWEALREWGADRGALDAARVLRLAGTRHGRTGEIVRVIWCDPQGGRAWPFDVLADEVLPLTRRELLDLRGERAQSTRAASPTPVRPFTPAGLWERRLADLQHLRILRGWEQGIPHGERDAWVFWAAVAVSWLSPPEVAEREVLALAEEAGWNAGEAQSRLCTTLRRAVDAAAGRRVLWQGALVDPRYRARRQTLVEWLHVTPDEQAHMQVLIGDELARQRHRDGKRERARSQGATPRDQYLRGAAERRETIRQLWDEGLSVRAIADRLGLGVGTVHRAIVKK